MRFKSGSLSILLAKVGTPLTCIDLTSPNVVRRVEYECVKVLNEVGLCYLQL